MFGILVLCAIVGLILLKLPVLLRFHRRYVFAKSLPGPSMLELRRATQSGDLLGWLQQNRQRYGSIYRIWLGLDLALHVSDPEMLRKILTSNDLINKARGYDLLRPWLGNGLLINGGEDWHQKRKMLTPAFHFKILSTFKEPMEECCDILCSQLAKVADGEQSVDVFKYVTLFALDVICGRLRLTREKVQYLELGQYYATITDYYELFEFYLLQRLQWESKFMLSLIVNSRSLCGPQKSKYINAVCFTTQRAD